MLALMEKIKLPAVLLGVMLLGLGIFSCVKYNQTPITFDKLNLNDLKGGTMVEDEVVANFGTYEEKYSTTLGIEDKSSKIWYYIIPVGQTEDKFMGIGVHVNDNGHEFEVQAKQTQEWIENSKNLPNRIKVKGSITKMNEQEQGFFLQTLIQEGLSPQEAQQAMVPYYLSVDAYSDYLIMIIIGACALVIGVVSYVVVAKSGY